MQIDLDYRRNELFKVDILLTSFTAATGLVAAVSSIFGMNLMNGGEEDNDPSSYHYFVLVAVLASVACVLVFALLVVYLRYNKLMFA